MGEILIDRIRNNVASRELAIVDLGLDEARPLYAEAAANDAPAAAPFARKKARTILGARVICAPAAAAAPGSADVAALEAGKAKYRETLKVMGERIMKGQTGVDDLAIWRIMISGKVMHPAHRLAREVVAMQRTTVASERSLSVSSTASRRYHVTALDLLHQRLSFSSWALPTTTGSPSCTPASVVTQQCLRSRRPFPMMPVSSACTPVSGVSCMIAQSSRPLHTH